MKAWRGGPWLALCLAWLLGASHPCPAQERLSLPQAVKLALEHNLPLANARLETEKAADQAAAARTHYLPKFNVVALGDQRLYPRNTSLGDTSLGIFLPFGLLPAQSAGDPNDPFLVGLFQISQPLSQLYRVHQGVKLAEAAQDLAQAELRLARHQLIAQVKKLYYALSQGQSTLEAARQALALHQEVDRLSQDHYAKGLMLEAERLEVAARLGKAQYELQAQQANLASVKEQLNHLLGRSPDHGLEPELVAEEPPSPREDDPQAACPAPRRPETEAARQRLELARRDLGYKQAERLPELSLVGSHVTQKNLPGLPENVSSVGLMLTWEPFDWGREAREAAAKARAVRQAENHLEETQRQAALEVRQEARRVGLARRMLLAARLAVEAAREKTRVVLNRFSLQAALVKDLTEAQAVLAEAQRDYAQALAAYWSARADLEKARGEDGP